MAYAFDLGHYGCELCQICSWPRIRREAEKNKLIKQFLRCSFNVCCPRMKDIRTFWKRSVGQVFLHQSFVRLLKRSLLLPSFVHLTIRSVKLHYNDRRILRFLRSCCGTLQLCPSPTTWKRDSVWLTRRNRRLIGHCGRLSPRPQQPCDGSELSLQPTGRP